MVEIHGHVIASLGLLPDVFILFTQFIQSQWMSDETFKTVIDPQEAKGNRTTEHRLEPLNLLSNDKRKMSKTAAINYWTITLIAQWSKVMFKILQRLLLYMEQEMSNVQAGFKKGSSTRHHIANMCWFPDNT